MRSYTAGFICEATKRFQMSLYSLYCSSLRCFLIESGWISTLVGRIASCASCAFFFDLKTFGRSGTNSLPYRFATTPRTSATASSLTRVESVRMYVMRPTGPPSRLRSMPS
ncbi:hypothetical protein SCE1572_31025 [Sorangium cellulosum So0157-2]|uniref:Uncharacterized protein n=1 Tax=Sorangium cellulosum So0157-2 TaxID=1254432 RepID=S4Y1A5_SORCE|nr:hypothetical protein [Sorangium cellulosum]AGP38519.1 hypothetical protein SCE1572_31025 [Sorangium cellulosum So0157-2]